MIGVERMPKAETVSERGGSQQDRKITKRDDRPNPRGNVGGNQQNINANHFALDIVALVVEWIGRDRAHVVFSSTQAGRSSGATRFNLLDANARGCGHGRREMRMRGGFDGDGDKSHLTVFDAALGDHSLRELSRRRGFAAQDGDFQTILMVEMNVHRRDMKLVVRVMFLRQSRRQFPRVMIEDIGERRKTLTGHAVIDSRSLQDPAARDHARPRSGSRSDSSP